MKRLLCAVAAMALGFALLSQAAPAYSFPDTARDWSAATSSSITTTSASVAVPARVGGGGTVVGISVRAPSGNSDVIYLRTTGTATSADLPLLPGEERELPHAGVSLSAVSASGTQSLIVIGYYK